MHNEQLKKYLAGELSMEERNAFEQEMENDPFLKESVEGLEAQGVFQTPGKLDALENHLNNSVDASLKKKIKGKAIPFQLIRFSLAAAFIGIVCFIGWKSFYFKKNFDEQAIYASYFNPLTHPEATIRGENEESSEASAIQAYEKEDYFEAVRQYEKLVAYNPADVKNALFLGISYLASNQAQKAIDLLNKHTSSTEYSDDIQWYLALAYLKNKNLNSALSIFQLLSHKDGYYKENANKIVEIMEGKLAMKD